ncbi:MAG TPA: TonB-dependent receptor [Candidatus Sulfomarinibacteraceae bacterium]|nr:TonB-dependent receptor [Candidatus Sulfomarinibacteraceae bacterium]
MRSNWLFRSTWLIGLVAVALTALPAVAQEEVSDEMIEQAMERSFEGEVTVTGSLIPRSDLTALSPVSVLEPEEITYSGVIRVEDLMTQMPQVFQAQNSTISNGASGTATVALRNLGSVRTLVLINGKRMPSGDAWATAPDLNFIPAMLIKRVDVLTGGASSVYGADAVAGVVNFVLDNEFEGVRASVNWMGYQHDNDNQFAQAANRAAGYDPPTGSSIDGDQYNVNVAMGGKFADGKGHGTFYVDFRNIDALTKAERDYTNCAWARGPEGPRCSGSGTIPAGRFLIFGPDPDYTFLGDYVLNENSNVLRPRAGDVYNYGPVNYMQRPDERWTSGGFVNYEFNEHFEAYGEIMFMDNYSDAQIAQSGNFGNTTVINCDNPMLSDEQRDILCQPDAVYIDPQGIPRSNVTILRRSIETGPRTSILRHTSWRIVTGLRGDISDAWSYDIYGLYAEVSSPQEYVGDLSVTRMIDALDVIGDPNDPSTWTCRSGNEGCAPWNLFVNNGQQIADNPALGVTQEAADYVALNMVLSSGTKTQLLNGTLTGDLEEYGLMFPSASEGIQVAVGAEYRKEWLYVHPDDNWENGNGSGQGGPTVRVDGEYSVTEGFVEALVPIVQDAPAFRDLSLELGYRYSDYSTSNDGFNNYKVLAAWAPTEAFKFRLGYNRATRAPNVRELFEPQGLGLGGSDDPCAGPDPAFSFEQCARTGVTAAQYGNILRNPADQYNSLDGGNPLLAPEQADTYTIGVVITPPSIRGLQATLDYYDIEITDTIGSLDPDSIIITCLNTGDPLLCSLINRDRAGTLWLFQEGFTESTNQNLGSLYSEGIDLTFGWLIGLGDAGFLNTSLLGTYTIASRYADPLQDYDCVGYYGNICGIPTPEWRHRARISWETNFNMVFTLGWRYNGEVLIDAASPDDDLAVPSQIESWRINGGYKNDAWNLFDLAWVWNIAKSYQFVLGVNNIFDKEPPLGAGLNDNDYGPGFYGFYDPYGRTLHASMQFTF